MTICCRMGWLCIGWLCGALLAGCGARNGSESTDAVDAVEQQASDAAPETGGNETVDAGHDVLSDLPGDGTTDAGDVLPDAALELDIPADEAEPDMGNPCLVDLDCDDQDWCTDETCIQGYCLYVTKSCKDGSACTDDSCDPATGLCHNVPSDCDDGNPCTLDGCKPTVGCTHEPIENCCPGTQISIEGFEGPLTWTVVDEITPAAGAATWQISSGNKYEGASSLYFGNLEKTNYDAGGRVLSYVESPELKLSATVATHARFWYWMDVEGTVNYDTVTLYLYAGGMQVPVFAKKTGQQMKKWLQADVNLQAFQGQTVRFRFLFDTIDGSDNAYEGVYVDSFRLLEMCPADGCVTKVECNDDLPCTQAHCFEGECSYALMPGCCLNTGNCVDDDPCTINTCKENVCQKVELSPPYCCYVPEDCNDANDCTDDNCDESGICFHPPSTAAGCCTEDVGCNDNDPCTIDKCKDFSCQFVNTCCFSDEECDDLDDVCTEDHCVAGKCLYQPTGVEGCCLVPYFRDDFSTDKGWEYGPEWGRGPAMASPPAVGYPDPSSDHTASDDNYIAGVVIGGNAPTDLHDYYWLTSPVINTQGAAALHLLFWRWLNSDYIPYMQNLIQVFNGGQWFQIWESGPPPAIQENAWSFQKLDVSKYAGPGFRFRIGFNIMQGGVYTTGSWNLDDVTVVDLAAVTPLCCMYETDCQGLYSPAMCSGGACTQ